MTMESIKPALEALEALISDFEQSISTKNSNGEQPNAEATKSTPAEISKAAPAEVSKVTPTDACKGVSPEDVSDAPVIPNAGKKKKKEKKPKQMAAPAVAPEISQFLQCDLRVGQVTNVSHHPEADGLYVLQVTYANDETKTVCAGLRKFLAEEEMSSRMVVTICNLKPRKLRGIASEAMILAGSVVSGEGEKETVVPISPPEEAQLGDIVKAQGIEGERTVTEGKLVSSKTWDKVVSRLSVKDGTACYDGKSLIVGGNAIGCKLPDGAEIH